MLLPHCALMWFLQTTSKRQGSEESSLAFKCISSRWDSSSITWPQPAGRKEHIWRADSNARRCQTLLKYLAKPSPPLKHVSRKYTSRETCGGLCTRRRAALYCTVLYANKPTLHFNTNYGCRCNKAHFVTSPASIHNQITYTKRQEGRLLLFTVTLTKRWGWHQRNITFLLAPGVGRCCGTKKLLVCDDRLSQGRKRPSMMPFKSGILHFSEFLQPVLSCSHFLVLVAVFECRREAQSEHDKSSLSLNICNRGEIYRNIKCCCWMWGKTLGGFWKQFFSAWPIDQNLPPSSHFHSLCLPASLHFSRPPSSECAYSSETALLWLFPSFPGLTPIFVSPFLAHFMHMLRINGLYGAHTHTLTSTQDTGWNCSFA